MIRTKMVTIKPQIIKINNEQTMEIPIPISIYIIDEESNQGKGESKCQRERVHL